MGNQFTAKEGGGVEVTGGLPGNVGEERPGIGQSYQKIGKRSAEEEGSRSELSEKYPRSTSEGLGERPAEKPPDVIPTFASTWQPDVTESGVAVEAGASGTTCSTLTALYGIQPLSSNQTPLIQVQTGVQPVSTSIQQVPAGSQPVLAGIQPVSSEIQPVSSSIQISTSPSGTQQASTVLSPTSSSLVIRSVVNTEQDNSACATAENPQPTGRQQNLLNNDQTIADSALTKQQAEFSSAGLELTTTTTDDQTSADEGIWRVPEHNLEQSSGDATLTTTWTEMPEGGISVLSGSTGQGLPPGAIGGPGKSDLVMMGVTQTPRQVTLVGGAQRGGVVQAGGDFRIASGATLTSASDSSAGYSTPLGLTAADVRTSNKSLTPFGLRTRRIDDALPTAGRRSSGEESSGNFPAAGILPVGYSPYRRTSDDSAERLKSSTEGGDLLTIRSHSHGPSPSSERAGAAISGAELNRKLATIAEGAGATSLPQRGVTFNVGTNNQSPRPGSRSPIKREGLSKAISMSYLPGTSPAQLLTSAQGGAEFESRALDDLSVSGSLKSELKGERSPRHRATIFSDIREKVFGVGTSGSQQQLPQLKPVQKVKKPEQPQQQQQPVSKEQGLRAPQSITISTAASPTVSGQLEKSSDTVAVSTWSENTDDVGSKKDVNSTNVFEASCPHAESDVQQLGQKLQQQHQQSHQQLQQPAALGHKGMSLSQQLLQLQVIKQKQLVKQEQQLLDDEQQLEDQLQRLQRLKEMQQQEQQMKQQQLKEKKEQELRELQEKEMALRQQKEEQILKFKQHQLELQQQFKQQQQQQMLQKEQQVLEQEQLRQKQLQQQILQQRQEQLLKEQEEVKKQQLKEKEEQEKAAEDQQKQRLQQQQQKIMELREKKALQLKQQQIVKETQQIQPTVSPEEQQLKANQQQQFSQQHAREQQMRKQLERQEKEQEQLRLKKLQLLQQQKQLLQQQQQEQQQPVTAVSTQQIILQQQPQQPPKPVVIASQQQSEMQQPQTFVVKQPAVTTSASSKGKPLTVEEQLAKEEQELLAKMAELQQQKELLRQQQLQQQKIIQQQQQQQQQPVKVQATSVQQTSVGQGQMNMGQGQVNVSGGPVNVSQSQISVGHVNLGQGQANMVQGQHVGPINIQTSSTRITSPTQQQQPTAVAQQVSTLTLAAPAVSVAPPAAVAAATSPISAASQVISTASIRNLSPAALLHDLVSSPVSKASSQTYFDTSSSSGAQTMTSPTSLMTSSAPQRGLQITTASVALQPDVRGSHLNPENKVQQQQQEQQRQLELDRQHRLEQQRKQQLEQQRQQQVEQQRKLEQQRQQQLEQQRKQQLEQQRQQQLEQQRNLEQQRIQQLEQQRKQQLEQQRQQQLEQQKRQEQQRQQQLEQQRKQQLEQQKQQQQLELQRQQQLEQERRDELEKERRRQDQQRQQLLEQQRQQKIEEQRQQALEHQRQQKLDQDRILNEQQRQLDLARQRQEELEQQKQLQENQRQQELERQQQEQIDKQRQLLAEQQRRLLEQQKQQELTRQRQQEIERQRLQQQEQQRQAADKQRQQRELDQQRQELERQRQQLEQQRQQLERQQQQQKLEEQRLDKLRQERLKQLAQHRMLEERRQQQQPSVNQTQATSISQPSSAHSAAASLLGTSSTSGQERKSAYEVKRDQQIEEIKQRANSKSPARSPGRTPLGGSSPEQSRNQPHSLGFKCAHVVEMLNKKEEDSKHRPPPKTGQAAQRRAAELLPLLGKSLDSSGMVRRQVTAGDGSTLSVIEFKPQEQPKRSPRLLRKPRPLKKSHTVDVSGLDVDPELARMLKSRKSSSSSCSSDEEYERGRDVSPSAAVGAGARRKSKEGGRGRDEDLGEATLAVPVSARVKQMETKVSKPFFNALKERATAYREEMHRQHVETSTASSDQQKQMRLANQLAAISDSSVGSRQQLHRRQQLQQLHQQPQQYDSLNPNRYEMNTTFSPTHMDMSATAPAALNLHLPATSYLDSGAETPSTPLTANLQAIAAQPRLMPEGAVGPPRRPQARPPGSLKVADSDDEFDQMVAINIKQLVEPGQEGQSTTSQVMSSESRSEVRISSSDQMLGVSGGDGAPMSPPIHQDVEVVKSVTHQERQQQQQQVEQQRQQEIEQRRAAMLRQQQQQLQQLQHQRQQQQLREQQEQQWRQQQQQQQQQQQRSPSLSPRVRRAKDPLREETEEVQDELSKLSMTEKLKLFQQKKRPSLERGEGSGRSRGAHRRENPSRFQTQSMCEAPVTTDEVSQAQALSSYSSYSLDAPPWSSQGTAHPGYSSASSSHTNPYQIPDLPSYMQPPGSRNQPIYRDF